VSPFLLTPASKRNSLEALIAKGELWLGSNSGSDTPLIRSETQDYSVTAFSVDEIDSALPYGGLPEGSINEIFSPTIEGVTELPLTIPSVFARRVLEKCRKNSHTTWCAPEEDSHIPEKKESLSHSFVWIGKRCWPTPFLLPKSSLKRCIFVDPPSPELSLWSLETALRSPSVAYVIADCPSFSLTTFRKLQFAARSSKAIAFLLRHEKDLTKPSCAYSQWRIIPSPSSQELPAWELSLLKVKGGISNISSWIVCAESSYEQGEKISIRILPQLVDRCNKTISPEEAVCEKEPPELKRWYGT
jgi:hypothetical protein